LDDLLFQYSVTVLVIQYFEEKLRGKLET
jgi:hypothetical protein